MATPLAAVITGDVVGSQKFEKAKYEQLLAQLNKVLNELAGRYDLRFDIFRGDEFQVVLQQPEYAFHVATLIRLNLLAEQVDVRQSIAVGEIDTLRNNVKSSTGDAFVRSGHQLEEMKSELLRFGSSHDELDFHLGTTIMVLDAHLSSLTKTEALVLACYLFHPDESHQSLADRLGKGRVNTTKLLNASGYNAVDTYLNYAKALIKQHAGGRNE
ncbi:MAG: hypothetical protein CMF18_08450 [Idiomarinaceae bacterium]|nr:hypothetical protein [Idiomarinaceae bacterium]|tara:strand:+ start:1593 stop:2234 length:642 start_codon:yes stop_codon:yes gene_type:complete